ncbi:MAG: cyclic nucleotide-binding domain-containing protein [Deltaproteobacteria bacterium]|nr:cyclic nucleotide-binding domain-containing protein [Deltaproteobacteria bacterium]OQX66297.1 MAG: hypothetical protein B5M55_00275 [Desulfococcus sp. 4484_242]
MADVRQEEFPAVTLTYEKGDLIIKEGDYGISVYKINRGRVLIYAERHGKNVPIATLGPDEIFGEIAFFNKGGEKRSASARALEQTELEAWHPAMLSKEYQEMPPALNYVVRQLVIRLLRMNRLLVQLTEQEEKRRKALEKSDPFVSRRRFYRKPVDLECYYRPVGLQAKSRLSGRIRNISLNGLGMEIAVQNTANVSHVVGDSFVIKTVLPSGKDLDLEAKIVSLKQSETPSRLLLGLSISRLSEETKKVLGFFLLP